MVTRFKRFRVEDLACLGSSYMLGHPPSMHMEPRVEIAKLMHRLTNPRAPVAQIMGFWVLYTL